MANRDDDPLGLRNLDYMLSPDYYRRYYFSAYGTRNFRPLCIVIGLVVVVAFVALIVKIAIPVLYPPPTIPYCQLQGVHCDLPPTRR